LEAFESENGAHFRLQLMGDDNG